MIPGRKSLELSRRLRAVESRNITYLAAEFPVFWESARGCEVRDVDGNRYLDCTAAFGVASLGHGSPAVRRALIKQSKKMWHGMGDVHPSAVKVALLEKLSALAPMRDGAIILASSGAEAVEAALKTARLATGKPGVLVFEGAYHGLTYGTLALTDRVEFTRPFADQTVPLATIVSYPDSVRGPSEPECLEQVERALTQSGTAFPVGAILVEPMQARGGVRIPDPGFLRELRRLADIHGVLLIVDEIYTGLGRTGERWAVDHSGIRPDILCSGKALGNGFPISAAIGTARVMAAWPPSDGEAIHTSTFLGNPLGCAMALTSLCELERLKLTARAKGMGAQWLATLKAKFSSHRRVAEVRGVGLLIGIELVKDRRSLAPDAAWAAQALKGCLKRGLFVLTAGKGRNVLALTPPLVITAAQIARATAILVEVLRE